MIICLQCKIPATVPWSHPKYANTCTCDNFLTLTLFQFQQDSNFLTKIGTSPSEMVLKAALSVMANGDIENGKAIMLDHLNLVIGFPKKEKFDCYGSEYDKCLQVFRAIWGT